MIKNDAISMVFDTSTEMDSFIDFITEFYDTDPEFNEILIKGNDVWFIFEGPDWDSVEYDEDDEDGDDIDDESVDTMVIGVIFNSNEVEVKLVKSR